MIGSKWCVRGDDTLGRHNAADGHCRYCCCPSDAMLLLLCRAVQVADAVSPDLVIFTMDGSIGQAAFDQAKAFKEAVEVRWEICRRFSIHR